MLKDRKEDERGRAWSESNVDVECKSGRSMHRGRVIRYILSDGAEESSVLEAGTGYKRQAAGKDKQSRRREESESTG